MLSYVAIEYAGYPGSGSVQLDRARATISQAGISYSGGPGVFSDDAVSWADISNTSFDHNGGYAVELRDGAANPAFASLTAT